MKISKYLFPLIVCSYANILLGQDAHLTDYRTFSNFFNPAQTGEFVGHIKLQASTRTQYERTYEQGFVGLQFNVLSPISKKHWIGIGANFLYDHSGTLSLDATGGDLLIGYHIPLGKKQNQTISIGGSLGLMSLSVDTKNYKSESTILGNPDPDRLALNSLNPQIFSGNVGIYFQSKIAKKHLFKTGLSLIRVNEPRFKVFGNTTGSAWGKRWNAHIAYRHTLNKMLQLEPAIYYSQSEYQKNLNLQAISEWKLAQNYKWRALVGLAQRWDESIDIITGYKSEQLYLSLSFDILTVSSADVIRNPGAIELGGYYIFHKHTRPKVKPIIFCPRL
jgi:type IX secretion system PorP/SprF family membrane protein